MEFLGGGPAFPFHIDKAATKVEDYSGMTLRDYFAAKAMQAMLRADTDNGRIRDDQICDRTADLAYRMADAMLRRLSE